MTESINEKFQRWMMEGKISADIKHLPVEEGIEKLVQIAFYAGMRSGFCLTGLTREDMVKIEDELDRFEATLTEKDGG